MSLRKLKKNIKSVTKNTPKNVTKEPMAELMKDRYYALAKKLEAEGIIYAADMHQGLYKNHFIEFIWPHIQKFCEEQGYYCQCNGQDRFTQSTKQHPWRWSVCIGQYAETISDALSSSVGPLIVHRVRHEDLEECLLLVAEEIWGIREISFNQTDAEETIKNE